MKDLFRTICKIFTLIAGLCSFFGFGMELYYQDQLRLSPNHPVIEDGLMIARDYKGQPKFVSSRFAKMDVLADQLSFGGAIVACVFFALSGGFKFRKFKPDF